MPNSWSLSSLGNRIWGLTQLPLSFPVLYECCVTLYYVCNQRRTTIIFKSSDQMHILEIRQRKHQSFVYTNHKLNWVFYRENKRHCFKSSAVIDFKLTLPTTLLIIYNPYTNPNSITRFRCLYGAKEIYLTHFHF